MSIFVLCYEYKWHISKLNYRNCWFTTGWNRIKVHSFIYWCVYKILPQYSFYYWKKSLIKWKKISYQMEKHFHQSFENKNFSYAWKAKIKQYWIKFLMMQKNYFIILFLLILLIFHCKILSVDSFFLFVIKWDKSSRWEMNKIE